jgi:hypothetical protein
MNNLDTNKGCGDDGITNTMLRLVFGSIDAPLCKLFSIIVFPDNLKTGTIVPIFKQQGDPSSPANYTFLLPSVSGRILPVH